MKRTVVIIAMLALAAGKLYASVPGRPIAGTAHDFTLGYEGDGGTYQASNMCTTCHAAHNAKRSVPLWGRETPTPTGWVVWWDNGKTPSPMGYTNADGTVMNGQALDPVNETGSAAKDANGNPLPTGELTFLSGQELAATGTGLCMSCHDGTIAINAVPDPSQDDHADGTPTLYSEAGAVFMNSDFRGKWGRDLTNMHPIGKYVRFGRPGWKDSILAGNTATGSNVALEGPYKDRVGCTSCHSMHSSDPASMRILRPAQICLSCHDR